MQLEMNDGRGMLHVRVEETCIQDFGAVVDTVHLFCRFAGGGGGG